MIYPITADECIAAVEQAGVTVTERDKRLCREIYIPLVNGAYQNGREGTGDYPLNVDDCIEYVERDGRCKLDKDNRRWLTSLFDWCNAVYEQGKREAKAVQE